MKTRYAFVVLAALTVLLTAIAILFTVHYVNQANHKFCQVVTAVASTPVQKPANPASAPVRQSQYEWQQRFAALGRSLGC